MRGICILLSGIMLITFAAGCKAKGPAGAVGKSCTADADCAGGKCIDMHDFDDGCTGKVCTVACTGDKDCPATFKEPDCETMPGGGKVCLYGEWEDKYCK